MASQEAPGSCASICCSISSPHSHGRLFGLVLLSGPAGRVDLCMKFWLSPHPHKFLHCLPSYEIARVKSQRRAHNWACGLTIAASQQVAVCTFCAQHWQRVAVVCEPVPPSLWQAGQVVAAIAGPIMWNESATHNSRSQSSTHQLYKIDEECAV